MNPDGTVSSSVEEPMCATDGCLNHAMPGSSYCGQCSTSWPPGNGGQNGGLDGTLSDGTNLSNDPNGGWVDGTLREDLMTPEEIRLAAYLVGVRAKYTDKETEALGKKGHAFKNPDGSYSFPIADRDDLENAIHAVGRSGSSHNAVRKYIISRAKELGAEDAIPDNWTADGSVKEEDSAETGQEDRDVDTAVLQAVIGAQQALDDVKTLQSWDEDDDPEDNAVDSAISAAADALNDLFDAQVEDIKSDRDDDDDDDDESRAASAAAERREQERKPRHRSSPTPRQEIRDSVTHFGLNDLKVEEIRSGSGASGEITLVGTPIVYNRSYSVHDPWGTFRETMATTVCDGVLASQHRLDCRFLINHDGIPLARTQPGTLELENESSGLRAVVHLDTRQTLANDLAIGIERGDITQMSCGFIVGEDEWNDQMDERTIHRFSELLDVSAVTYPASPTTHIQIAQRMMQAQPIESRARIRELYQIVNEVRAGRKLNSHNAQMLLTALESLHQADDLDPEDFAGRAAALVTAHRQASEALRNVDGLELEPTADNSDESDSNGSITDPGESIRSEDEAKTLRRERLLKRREQLARHRFMR